jgi:dTMP kinase
MVALVDRYIFSLMARARVRGLTAEWVENLFGFALVPDLVVYLDIDIEHLVPRVLSTTGFDYWESGQDYLPSPDVYQNFVEHQTRLLAEFRRLATEHAFTTVDARGPIAEVFRSLCDVIEPVLQSMATVDSMAETRDAVASSLL